MDYTFGKLIFNLHKGGQPYAYFYFRREKEQGISQKELAEVVGVTEASMSRYMHSERIPKSAIIANIATALHTTSDYLLGTETEGGSENEFGKIKRLLARNALTMTTEQKRELINTLLSD